MSLLQNAYGGGAAAVNPINNSLRFRASASAYLSRTFATPTSSTIWTLSAWVKRGTLGGTLRLFGASTTTYLTFNSSDQLNLTLNGTSAATTTAVYRDPAAFLHIVYQQNGAAQTIYVNNVSVATGTTAAAIFNTAIVHQIAAANTSNYFDGVLAQVCFVDGQALTPSSFGATDTTSGEWKPLTAAQIRTNVGTWGNNGFMLLFNGTPGATIYDRKASDTDTAGNNWTATNVSTTPGTTYDWLIDSPTNGSASLNAVGNYCTWNPLNTATTAALTAAKLDAGASGIAIGNTGMSTSGTYYWEITSTGGTSTCGMWNGSATTTTTVTTGTTKGFRYNAATGAFDWTSDGTTWNSIATGLTTYPYFPYVSTAAATTASLNCGQKPFVYAPTGVVGLCSTNLPTPTVKKGSTHFQTKLDTGANIKTTCEAVYTYLLEWIKDRANANNHQLLDTVRGLAGNALQSNTTSPGAAYSAPAGNSVGWCWNLAGAAASNTSGSITSSVAVNATAGIAVGTYTGTGANATVGHGLGFAPTAADGYMILVKDTTAASANNWMVMHSGLTSAAYYMILNTTGVQASDTTVWQSTAPTSSVFSIGTHAAVNTSGHTYEFIVFFGVAGFSKFGNYTGNGNADGPFIYTGFAPSASIIKKYTVATNQWLMQCYSVDKSNIVTHGVYSESNIAESASESTMDYLSNGFKIRSSTLNDVNTNGSGYIYSLFAATPLNHSNAR